MGTGYDYKKKYEFQLSYADKLSSATFTQTVKEGEPIFDFGKDKNGNNYFNVNGSIYRTDNVNRGAWNAPTSGMITQKCDNSGSQNSVIVGLKNNGTSRLYGLDFLNSENDPQARLYVGNSYLGLDSNAPYFNNKRIPYANGTTNNVDANNLGYFGQNYLGTGCSNLPNGTAYQQILTLGNNGDLAQIAIGVSSRQMFSRVRNGANWSNWKAVSHKSIMTVKATANQKITTANTWTKIIFPQVLSSQGNGFTLKNNEIIVNKGISKVKISCNIWAETAVGYSWVKILKGQSEIANNIQPINTSQPWRAHTISPILVDVTEGTAFDCQIVFSVANANNRVSGGDYVNSVTLTVEEV